MTMRNFEKMQKNTTIYGLLTDHQKKLLEQYKESLVEGLVVNKSGPNWSGLVGEATKMIIWNEVDFPPVWDQGTVYRIHKNTVEKEPDQIEKYKSIIANYLGQPVKLYEIYEDIDCVATPIYKFKYINGNGDEDENFLAGSPTIKGFAGYYYPEQEALSAQSFLMVDKEDDEVNDIFDVAILELEYNIKIVRPKYVVYLED